VAGWAHLYLQLGTIYIYIYIYIYDWSTDGVIFEFVY